MFKNKLGCYRCGDRVFYSKLDAIDYHAKTGIHPHWDFNEEVFNSYNWKLEPKETLSELYKQRALQIRNLYDYVIIPYSGGADSFNVLDTFLSNDIKVDEVATFINYEGTKDRDHYYNAEPFRVVAPTIEKLKDQYPWIKHTVVDITKLIIDQFSDDTNKFDWFYNKNMFFSPNTVATANIGIKLPQWKKIIDSGKKVCIVWGMDKPRLVHVDGKFVFRFLDIIDVNVLSMSGNCPYVDEAFYWTPDQPKIVIKQAHILKNYMNSFLLTSPFISTNKSDLAFKEYQGKKYWLSVHGVHSLIYPSWDINTFTNGKPKSCVYTIRDDWFWKESNSIVQSHVWEMGIQKIWDMVPDYWKNDPSDIHRGLKGCWSKDYFLE